MKNFVLLLLMLFTGGAAFSQACIVVDEDQNPDACNFQYCGPYKLSDGIYRIPYEDGIFVEVTNDHLKHCPRGAIDMHGTIYTEFSIVAAADGWIRAISDANTEQCSCKNGDNCDNNYVWMEHLNGEWTKYTHLQTGSSSALHNVGDWVSSGTVLGQEGTVGCSTGDHLHFEVAAPVDTNTLLFDAGGGWIDEDWADNLIPVFCNITGNVMQRDEVYFASDCATDCDGFLADAPYAISIGEYEVVLNASTVSNTDDFTVEAFGTALFQAGTSVTLTPGFHALAEASFTAQIGACDESPLKVTAGETAFGATENSTMAFGLYPNPAGREVMIKFDEPVTENFFIQLQDVTGKVIVSQSFSGEQGKIEWPLILPELAKGIYLLTVHQSGKQLQSHPLAIQ
jgi:hypothetical protein